MAKLLCIARWPETHPNPADYPVDLSLIFDPETAPGPDLAAPDWTHCTVEIGLQKSARSKRRSFSTRSGPMLVRDVRRLTVDLKEMVQQKSSGSLTFIPVVPFFELWVHGLTGDQYRVINWMDLADHFNGADDLAYEGVRFLTNRSRLMGFIRSLEADLKTLDKSPS
ncbi:MAG: hypothetical protein GYB68_01445 [Chloroflexi bacterium]|nr:hypothetical protein [Chloroflexota bacterium]